MYQSRDKSAATASAWSVLTAVLIKTGVVLIG
jgi:hypothetical protein